MNKIIAYFKNLTLTTNQLLFFTCCYIALILNLPFLVKTADVITALDNYNLLFLMSLPIFLLSLSIIIQGVFSFRWLTKPLLITTVMISSLIFYGTITYGIVFDYGMVQNTVETDSAEALSYVNLYAILFFLIFGVIPSLIIYTIKLTYKPFFTELLSRVKMITLSFGAAFLIASVFYSNYASVGRNNKELLGYVTPYKLLDASYKFVRNQYFYPPLQFKILDTAPSIVRDNTRRHVTVMVLGETARAQSFSLNGYAKPTNKYTEKQGVISFSQMSSCGTATAVSVPCMFSRLNKNNYDKRIATTQQNAIDLIHLAGTDVLWISNNNGSCKGVCTRVKTEQIEPDKSNPLCDGEYCYDEALLAPLKNKLKTLSHENTLIVLHMIGSHGPTYFKRYPKEKRVFTPDCQRSDIQNCSHEQLINTYDNTIAYTDLVLSKIINELSGLDKKDDIETSLLYISDHGESLGENGVYLHGLPYAFAPEEQTHVPMIYWTDKIQNDFNRQCLNALAKSPISHDNVFDTLLSIMSIKTTAYRIESDPFIDCKSQQAIARTTVSTSLEMELAD
ncbi:phosphoethanolamine--lipid A transferase [Colwellia sp. MB3u-70]|uniref:phosphoethanolamine transferase n=1 Tax=unclassified Colwellia TaxID=196834 RepID=UPI0015F6862A|nr:MULTISPECIES: phosphoethanolamine--lipid A transferase [unclassified Colwellia]MBA6291178.1 phosphoethanolamine--lipid A transferase [Colwellia sp. MB3u-8]MBA6305903.1 phosphoethanolamine--lipid A transferase [Colwellia sp. MB3u-70]